MNLKIELPDDMKQFASMIPNKKKSNTVLFFNHKERLYKLSEQVEIPENEPFEECGVHVKIILKSIWKTF